MSKDDGDIAVVSEGNVDNDSDIAVENDTDEVQQSSPNVSFTVEQEQLFKCCFKEGYNIFIDADYVRWLKLHHPESCPNDGSDCDLNNDSIISQLSDIIPASPVLFSVMEESEELASQLEFASVLNTVDESMTDIPISTTGNTVSVVGPSKSSTQLSVPGPSTSGTPLSIPGPSTSSTPLSVVGPSTSSTALSVTSPSTSCTPLSVPGPSTSSTPLTSILSTPVRICTTISPILQQLKALTYSTKGRATPQARLLTSNESLAQLQEKEKKKSKLRKRKGKSKKGQRRKEYVKKI